jgi:hypothetical protein
MTTYVLRNGELVEKEYAAPLESSNGAPHVIRDTMDETRHMATGRMFTSKRGFRAETRAAGCVEIGDHKFKPRVPIKLDKRQRVEHIQRAIHDLRNGVRR